MVFLKKKIEGKIVKKTHRLGVDRRERKAHWRKRGFEAQKKKKNLQSTRRPALCVFWNFFDQKCSLQKP